MPKNNTVYVGMLLNVKDVAASLCQENNYEALIELILAIDAAQQDWEFTRMLKAAIDNVLEEGDENERVNSKNV